MKPARELTDVEIVERMANNPTYCTRREPKPCEKCGYIRTVSISFIAVRGGERDHTWSKRCAACEAESRSRHYAHESRRFAEKAIELRAKQQMQVQRRMMGRRA